MAIVAHPNAYVSLAMTYLPERIKIRLFITPILFLLGRGRSQTVKRSTVNCQLLKYFPSHTLTIYTASLLAPNDF
ncbi:MAG: hypothetical protein EAZ88_02495 [Oscillatoriales cyanobacterium]|nr:MAG: hypothetical protein EAZ88_02495 [Oscillatoriales cyanobacterium]